MEKEVVQLTLGDHLWTWFDANKTKVAWGAGVAVVVGLVVAFYVWRLGENEIAAGEALTRAEEGAVIDGVARHDSPDVYSKVANEYPGTSAGGRALLQAAGSLFVQQKYAEAQAQFDRFVREYPDNPFLPQAKLGVAASLDAQGKTSDAVTAYESVAKNYSGMNVAPQAEFALARIYESQGKSEQAWALYEKLAQQLGLNDAIGAEAGIRAEEIKVKLPPPPPSTNSAPAFFQPLKSQSPQSPGSNAP